MACDGFVAELDFLVCIGSSVLGSILLLLVTITVCWMLFILIVGVYQRLLWFRVSSGFRVSGYAIFGISVSGAPLFGGVWIWN